MPFFYEFEEIGCNAQLGYASPADVADQYPRFFWSKVEPFIGDVLNHLELTAESPQWMTNLYRNVFDIENGRRTGPCGTAAKVLRPFAPHLAEAEWIWLPVKLPGVIKYVFGLGKV